MKKVAIVTIYNQHVNYGNKLQCYATKNVLEKMGCSVTTLITDKQPPYMKYKISSAINALFRYKIREKSNQIIWEKFCAYERFNKQYLNPSNEQLKNNLDETSYDYFVVGSDQVWNTSWYNERLAHTYLLTFARPEQKVCFSPSFGIEELPDKWIPWFKEHLNTFPNISVREQAGARVVKQLTGRDATVLIDPTMMLDADEWIKIAREPKRTDCSKPYILTYFIGGRSDRVNMDINRFSKENDFRVYNLLDETQPRIFVSGPREFVYLVSNASLIMTDSFHACVFSFLFQKPFLVYNREGTESTMMSRMDTLLSNFDLERKYADSGLTNELLESNYSVGYCQLEKERTKVADFLKKSIK